MQRKRILFVYTSFSSFVETDYNILSKFADVKQYKFESSKIIFKMIFEQVKLKIFLLMNIWKYDLIYCWFADYHSFLPILFSKLFKKKSILVLGGYDVTYIPELKYGSFSNPLRSFCAKFSIKNVTLNLSVSDNIRKEALERVLTNIPTNLEIIGKMKQKKLIEYYQKAKVYAQFSMREGLPNAVCESMLCECIAVGFNNGGIPIAIGDCGFILDERNIDMAAELIDKAISSPKSLGKKARERIIKKFPLENRKKKLHKLLAN